MSINEQSLAYGSSKSRIREIAAYGAARKAEIGVDKVFDFSLGNPSIPAPDDVRKSIERLVAMPAAKLHSYTPASGLPEVRASIAQSINKRFAVESTELYGSDSLAEANDLYMTCGAAASITITLGALCNPGDEVMVVAPYFPEYRVWIESSQATCVEVMADSSSFQLDIAALRSALNENTKALIINSPNNPTGVVYSRESLVELAALLTEHSEKTGNTVYLIADEPYRELVYGGAEVPWLPGIYANTIVCYSYSKSLSLPGERIGWVLVSPRCAEHDQLVAAVAGAGRKLGFVCAPALFQRVIADCVDLEPNVEAYEHNRQLLMEGLGKLGYEFVEPQGAFYLWMKALEPDADAFFEKARELELLPVPSDSFGCPGWVRIGYCVDAQTIEGSMDAWAQLMESYR
ncbi:MAG: pyridoxal phosphate-dependent aminotransferase [Atopobiaceae bacterium]|nr:pyridoxal phosphate-dependent aminotransferase [Atopobiaceae bacterium]